MTKKLKIIYYGTPEFAVEGLKVLLENNYNIVGVVTAPDKPAGRGQKIQESDVKKFAVKNNLKVLQPKNLKSEEFQAELKSLEADLQIIVAFRMLPKQVWDMPKYGTFNLHASLLPQYRGAAPINWAIINGETETGVTSFFLNENIDTGNIILQEKIEISENDNVGTLYEKLMKLGGKVILKTVEQIEQRTVKEKKQDEILKGTEPKSAPKIFRKDLNIDWCKSSKEIYDYIRGLSPYPVAWTKLGGKTLKIYKAEYSLENQNKNCGEIISDKKTFMHICTKDGIIKLLEVQLEGKKKMQIDEFLRGANNIEFTID
jgi:methionyl-tRNA formyltransferase